MIETLERPKEKIGSDAFRIEYGQDISKNVLVDDIVSYLGEYRFKLPKYSYNLDFADGQLIDPHRLESMESMSQRAIDLKNSEGKSSARERSEKIGFQKLDRQLRLAKSGDTVIWMSPMGPKSEGYGDYGYVFFGKVNGDGPYKKISMIAKRIDNPTIDQFNRANKILAQETKAYQQAEEFLSNPKVLSHDLSEENLDSVLKMVFAFKPNEKIQKMFKQVMSRVSSMISDLADLLMNPWKRKEEKIKGLNSLENYVLKLKNEYEVLPWEKIIYEKKQRISDIVGDYGHKPPVVAGSCGSTGNKDGFSTSNIFSKTGLNSILSEQEWFNCPKCDYKADGPVGNQCPGCGLTKEAYAKKSGVVCE